MTKQRLVELLDEAESVYVSCELSKHDGGLDVPVGRDDVVRLLGLNPEWWDDEVEYLADWDEEDRSLYVGRNYD